MAYEKLKTEAYSLLGGINVKASPYVTGKMEFRDLTNLNFFVPGALTQRPGTSLYIGSTVLGRITGAVEFERLSGASYIVLTANTNAYTANPGIVSFKTGLANGALFDFVTFVDRLFAANGQDFFLFDGSNANNFGVHYGATGWGVTAIVGGSLSPGVTGTFVTSYGYLTDRGFFGPVTSGITIVLNGVTFNSIGYYGLTATAGYGITAIALYRTTRDGVDLTGTTFVSTATSSVTDPGWPLGARLAPPIIQFTLAPRYMEIYNNQLFMAGFSSVPSTLWWSEIGEPQGIEPDFFGEFRTNDGDRITGLKAYSGVLIVTKQRSFHRVTGDNPSNFAFQEISDQYGCLSNRAMIVYQDKLWFLDSKGVVEFNGANVSVVSDKVEDFFFNMNVDAAIDNAVAIHNRPYNEIWFAIPANGATTNNRIVVYDYLAESWTKYEGLQVSALMNARGSLQAKTIFYGGYSGILCCFDRSIPNDLGQAITCGFDSPFLAPGGQTTEQQFRRLYMNLEPIVGFTQPISIRMKTNYGSTVQLERTMYQSPFQSRIDFGLSAKSLQIQMQSASASFPMRVYGYAIESRFQRST